MNEESSWLRWEPPDLRRFGYSGRMIVASIVRDSVGTGWHWKIMDVVKPPRRERWTLHGKAASEDEARLAAEFAWRKLCEAYGLKPAGEHQAL